MRFAVLVLLVSLLVSCKKKEKELARAIGGCDEDAGIAALSAGADPKATVDGKPVIAGAGKCLADHCDLDLALLDKGVDPNSKTEEGTPWLVVAAAAGHAPCTRTILAKGGRLEERDAKGQTALIAAAAGGHLGVVEMLIDRGADLNAKTSSGITAIEAAERNGHTAVVAALKRGKR